MSNQQYTVASPTVNHDQIPTLTERYEPEASHPSAEQILDQLCNHLQSSVNHQLYQAMSATLHQLVNKESSRLKDKIKTQIRDQLPALIKLYNP